MKIIFLDVDGVLNSSPWREAHGAKTLDPACVALLQYITRETDARLVITSEWRYDLLYFAGALKKAQGKGLLGRILSITGEGSIHARPKLIQEWLDLHQGDVERFVILDDFPELEHLEPHVVRCTNDTGLSLGCAEAAIKHLNTKE